jgi:Tol biopolymer transport system component
VARLYVALTPTRDNGGVQRAAIVVALLILGVVDAAARPSDPPQLTFSSDTGSPGNMQLVVVAPDGSNLRKLTSHAPRGIDAAWSPDGKRLAFSALFGSESSSTGTSSIWTMARDGRNPRPLVAADDARLATWSPDGRRLAFIQEGGVEVGLRVVSADGSGLRRIATKTKPFDFAWSPDGRSIAYDDCTPGCALWVSPVDGGPRRRITAPREKVHRRLQTSVLVRQPTWSRDGKRIAFVDDLSAELRPSQVRVVGSDGLRERAVARGIDAAISPDGKNVAFVAAGAYGATRGVWVARVGAGKPRRLADPPGREFALAWSGDGRKLVFATNFYGRRRALLVANFASGRVAPLTPKTRPRAVRGDRRWAPDATAFAAPVLSTNGERRPGVTVLRVGAPPLKLLGRRSDSGGVWSTDGRRLAFVRNTASGARVLVANADRRIVRDLGTGAQPRWSSRGALGFMRKGRVVVVSPEGRRTELRLAATSFGWAPDGKRIAFGRGPELWVANANGSARRRLVRYAQGRVNCGPRDDDTGPKSVYLPSWSRDGSAIVYNVDLYCGESAIALVRADGSRQKQLVRNLNVHLSPAQVSWSPDGTRFVFGGGPQLRITIANRNGTNRRELAAGDQPEWSPDGTLIAFRRTGGRTSDVYVVPASGGAPRRVSPPGQNADPSWRP